MCWCDIVSKAKIGSLKHLGNGMEGSLRFLAEIIVGLSILVIRPYNYIEIYKRRLVI